MKEPLKITVVTPTFNSEATLRETIESVRNQTYGNVEHIMMDGKSIDGTLDIISGYPNLIVRSEKDKGHYDAMNKGIALATGDVIAILNSDDTYGSDALAEVAAAFGAHPEWDALFCDVVYIDGEGNEIFRRREAGFDYDILRFAMCYIVHPTLFLRKSTYDKVGNYEYEKYLNACDYSLILRLGRHKCTVGHIPKCLVNYRFHEHGQSADIRVMHNTARESRLIRQEHGCPAGFTGHIYETLYRTKRQLQKLIHRGTVDLVPGKFLLKKHLREKASFSSNIGIDKL